MPLNLSFSSWVRLMSFLVCVPCLLLYMDFVSYRLILIYNSNSRKRPMFVKSIIICEKHMFVWTCYSVGMRLNVLVHFYFQLPCRRQLGWSLSTSRHRQVNHILLYYSLQSWGNLQAADYYLMWTYSPVLLNPQVYYISIITLNYLHLRI